MDDKHNDAHPGETGGSEDELIERIIQILQNLLLNFMSELMQLLIELISRRGEHSHNNPQPVTTLPGHEDHDHVH